MRRLRIFLLLLATGAHPGGASAQDPEALPPGLRVRVHAQRLELRPVVGSVERDQPDTLHIRVRGGVRPIAWAEVDSLDWSRGRRRGVGAVRGAAIGALAGGILGAGLLFSMHDGTDAHTGPGRAAAFGFMIGGSIGFWPGMALGRERGPDRWQRVGLEGRRR